MESFLVLEGDWGGQIYMIVPMRLIGKNPKVGKLLRYLDTFSWSCNRGEGRSAYIAQGEDGDAVSGGMGGGMVVAGGIWLHNEYKDKRWFKLVQILLGMADGFLTCQTRPTWDETKEVDY